MRILVTGGTGFIGRNLIEYLIKAHEVFLIGQKKNIESFEINSKNTIPYFYTDYSLESLFSTLNKIKPEAIVHLAAQRPTKEIKIVSAFIQNLIISSNLFVACLKVGITNIVYISSKSVYSSKNPIPWTEHVQSTPENEYGLSKIWVEQAANFFSDRGLNIKTIRLAQVIGIGEREGYVLQIYLDNARKNLPLKVFGNDIGKRHYVYIMDVLRAIELCLMKSELSGVFNIGMKNNYSFFEIAETINMVFSNKSGIIRMPEMKSDENIYLMSIDKAKEILSWEPVFDLELSYEDIKIQISGNHRVK
jgi:nucleoside-diphosphate-sugar epimerase